MKDRGITISWTQLQAGFSGNIGEPVFKARDMADPRMDSPRNKL